MQRPEPISRRTLLSACGLAALASSCAREETSQRSSKPNILFAISDDQSYPYASAYGIEFVKTPAFDRVAKEGVLFTNAFSPSPGCSPTRASLLTGRHIWQIENAGTHASSFPAKYATFPDLLEEAGYFPGFTGKGWGPGKWQDERKRNPAGPQFSQKKLDPPYSKIATNDYAANFEAFLAQKPEDKPFVFWYGATEPHREFEAGIGRKEGKVPANAIVPPFLPDRPEIREDLLDYAVEIEWFDKHLGRMLDVLQQRGELKNTLVIVTSDNGMAFPRAKANLYEHGIHMPLAIQWTARAPGGRVVDDLVGFIDLTATILEAAAVQPPTEFPPAGRSLVPLLVSDKAGLVEPAEREAVYSARERHSSSRYQNWGYPSRAIRTHDYLYIRNFHPERWPAGDPRKIEENGKLGEMHGGYHDIDACPSLDYLVKNRNDRGIRRYLQLAVGKRPAEELFDIKKDPGCLNNLAKQPEHQAKRQELAAKLEAYLKKTGDPRVTGEDPEIFETYPRYSPIRTFPAPSESD